MLQRTKQTENPTEKTTENISNEYDNLSSHKVLTSTHPKKSSSMSMSNSTKYQVETIYLGIADNKQVEEEIITILKAQFLSKITTDASYLSALQSSSNKEQKEKNKER